jgi:hypothetical protein
MAHYDTGDLHRRQQTGDVGHAILGSQAKSSKKRWRALLVPLAVLAVGFLLGMWGPLPGLGMVLVLGGVLGLVMSVGILLTDGLS